MRCEMIQYQMAAYVAHELPDETSLYIKQHLLTCKECQAWYDDVAEMSEIWNEPAMYSEMPELPDLMDNVMDEIRQMPVHVSRNAFKKKSQSSRRTAVFHYAIAACLTFLLFQFNVFELLGNGITEATQHFSSNVENMFKEAKQ